VRDEASGTSGGDVGSDSGSGSTNDDDDADDGGEDDDDDGIIPSVADLRVISKFGDGLRGMVDDIEWRLKQQVRFGLAAGIGVVRLLVAREAVQSLAAARERYQAQEKLVLLAAQDEQSKQKAATAKISRK